MGGLIPVATEIVFWVVLPVVVGGLEVEVVDAA
jgi:hypothetical protein